MRPHPLDDLPLLAEIQPSPRKLTKAEREWQDDWERSRAMRATVQDYFFRSYLRTYTLQDVQRIWFEEQAKLRQEVVTPWEDES